MKFKVHASKYVVVHLLFFFKIGPHSAMAILIFETKILDQYHHLTWARVNYNFSSGSIPSPHLGKFKM